MERESPLTTPFSFLPGFCLRFTVAVRSSPGSSVRMTIEGICSLPGVAIAISVYRQRRVSASLLLLAGPLDCARTAEHCDDAT